MDAGEPVGVALELGEEVGRVPQVPRVEDEPDVGDARLVGEVGRLLERRDERPVVAEGGAHRLQRDRDPVPRGLLGNVPQPFDDDLPRLVLVQVAGRPGQADDRGRLERREPADARADRLDALLRRLGPRQLGEREERGHGGHAARGREPARTEGRKLLVLAALLQLQLADRDPARARSRVRREVVLEARVERRELADGEEGIGRGHLGERAIRGLDSCAFAEVRHDPRGEELLRLDRLPVGEPARVHRDRHLRQALADVAHRLDPLDHVVRRADPDDVVLDHLLVGRRRPAPRGSRPCRSRSRRPASPRPAAGVVLGERRGVAREELLHALLGLPPRGVAVLVDVARVDPDDVRLVPCSAHLAR